MYYKKFAPSPQLLDYVVSYYIWESEHKLETPFTITSHANGCFAMVFNYGDPYQVSNSSNSKTTPPQHFLCGQSSKAYMLHLSGTIGMVGIIFHNAAFRSLFAIPNPLEIMDKRIDLTDILGKETAVIAEQLAQASFPMEKRLILDAFLLNRLRRVGNELKIADQAANIILEHRGMIRMDDLANQLFIGPRQLRRCFKSRMGINPKYFARLKRFSYVNLCLTQGTHGSWRSFLDQNAYYDQAHFIKDYKEFYGKSPALQIRENREVEVELSPA